MNGSTPARRQPAPPAILAELRRMDALELQLLRSVLVDALQRARSARARATEFGVQRFLCYCLGWLSLAAAMRVDEDRGRRLCPSVGATNEMGNFWSSPSARR